MEWNQQIRVRVNGLLISGRSLLMIQLVSPVNDELVWMPPGGGLAFGEPLKTAVKRELAEETGLQVSADSLWYIHELHTARIHAVEFYFLCRKTGGVLAKGTDPEYAGKDQIIRDVAFLPFKELDRPDVYPAYLRTGFAADYLSDQTGLPKII